MWGDTKMNEKEFKINNKMRIVIFIIISILIIIATIIVVIAFSNRTSNNNSEIINENDSKNNYINIYSNSENKPSISGEENVKIENGVKINKSDKISRQRKVGIYIFDDIKLQKNSNGTVLTAKVSTTSEKKEGGKDFVINFYDKEEKLVSKMNIYVGYIKQGETINLRAESTSDLSNAYDMEIAEK